MSTTTTTTTPRNTYGLGYEASQVQHHEWRTAENSTAYLLPHLRRAVEQNPGLRVLDVGAGSGTISASLAAYLPEGELVATDISEAILERARAHAAARGVRNVTFRAADAYALPFADASFDVVHAHQVLCHLSAPVDALREMLRVTRPGGLVAVRESDMRMWCFWPETPALEKFHRLAVDVMLANGGQDKGGRQLVSWVLAAGVKRADVEASFGTWCYSTPEDRRAWGEAMIGRLKEGPMRSKALETGLATEEEIEEMVKAWEEWIRTDSATLGIMNGEVVIKKA
ncbi:e0457765-177d-4f87-a10c-ad29bd81645c [Thermothielavioides terrestris]|uniref:E0457765-177d-4f87-a10c-ad29bd81645c n=1 Tax=Thermothielavioides terrestris TaxID=2587410 RepID=A0A3S4BQC0_9PEZI|nr:e0457765-177d-4f87-a10c-ad29bd81645c [Thermothielavioides terrestris]